MSEVMFDVKTLQAEKDRFAAMVGANGPALEKLLADDLSYTHSHAQVQDNAALISDIKTGKIKYVSIAPGE